MCMHIKCIRLIFNYVNFIFIYQSDLNQLL